MHQAERILQREVIVRLGLAERSGALDCIVIGSANGIFIPARTEAEKTLARRVVHQMKQDGMLTPGAPDLLFLWRDGCGGIELKRPASASLFVRRAKGKPSPDQRAFKQRAFALQIPYAICDSWESVRDTLIAWGRLRANYGRNAV